MHPNDTETDMMTNNDDTIAPASQSDDVIKAQDDDTTLTPDTPQALAEEPLHEVDMAIAEDAEDDDAQDDLVSPTAVGPKQPRIKEKTIQPLGVQPTEEEAPLVHGVAQKQSKALRKRWYIVHTYSGHENKVKINLERRIESMNMGHKIFSVEVPQKTVTKIKDGKRQEKEERLFPGYVLVEMAMDDDSWYVVRHTPGVIKFAGSEKKPVPAKDSEIKRILARSAPTKTEKVEVDIKVGNNIRIISGPFADFDGTVTEVNPEKGTIMASVSIFGRDTPVELAFNQIQKI